MLLLIMFLMFTAVALLGISLVPMLFTQTEDINKKQAQKFVRKMDRVLQQDELQKMYKVFLFAPVVCAVAGFLLFPPAMRAAGVVAGIVLGLVLPRG